MPLDGLNPDFFRIEGASILRYREWHDFANQQQEGKTIKKTSQFHPICPVTTMPADLYRLALWSSPCCPAFRIIVSLNRSRIRACIHRDAISPYTTFPPCSFEHLVPNFILTRTWTQTRWNIPVVSKKQCVDDMVALRWDLTPLLHREKTSSVCLNFIGS